MYEHSAVQGLHGSQKLPRALALPSCLELEWDVKGLYPITGMEVVNVSLKLMPTKQARQTFLLCSPGGAAVRLTFVHWEVEPNT